MMHSALFLLLSFSTPAQAPSEPTVSGQASVQNDPSQPQQEDTSSTEASSAASTEPPVAAPDDAMPAPIEDVRIVLLKRALAAAKVAAVQGDVAAFDLRLTQKHRASLDALSLLCKENSRGQGAANAENPYARSAVLRAFSQRKAVFQSVSFQSNTEAEIVLQTLGVAEVLPMIYEDGLWRIGPTSSLLLEKDRLEKRATAKASAAEKLAVEKPSSSLASSTDSSKQGGHGHDHSEPDHDDTGPSSQPTMGGPNLEHAPWWWQVFDGNSAWHYVLYAPDYLFVAASAGVYFSGLYNATDPFPALIGPNFAARRPPQIAFNDYRLDGVIGRPFLQQKVPALTLGLVGVGALGVAGVVDGVRHTDFHHTHAFALGALTALASTLTVVEVSKIAFGRLRPDYRDRYNRAACGGVINDAAVNCETSFGGGPYDGFAIDEDELRDGRKSFPSGHAASSFAFATYLSLYLGGEYIWGDGASSMSVPIATGVIGVAYGLAAFTAGSRISDNKHHPEDVAVGAVLGTALSAASYFIHFDLDGNARYRVTRMSPLVTEGGGGVQISGEF